MDIVERPDELFALSDKVGQHSPSARGHMGASNEATPRFELATYSAKDERGREIRRVYTYVATGMNCPDCGGTGQVTLLVSKGPCAKCHGTGRAGRLEVESHPQQEEPVSPPMIRRYTYDDHARVAEEFAFDTGEWRRVDDGDVQYS